MKGFSNKRPSLRVLHMIACIWFCVNTIYAQHGDTVSLKTIEVVATKKNLAQIGKKVEMIDSNVRAQFSTLSVAELLSINTGIFIKNYGPGAIATTAFRGGNASQTAVLWNGLNIQNTMLGQADLSLLPVSLFDEVSVEYGGSSALWGSGAMGGSIRFGNAITNHPGSKLRINLSTGSFGKNTGSAAYTFASKKFSSSTRIYRSASENNYEYVDPENDQAKKRVSNASYLLRGLLQEFGWKITPKQNLSLNFWANANDRQIAGTTTTPLSKSNQYDESLRASVNWAYTELKYQSSVKAAFFSDKINYNDSLAGIFARNVVRSFIAETDHTFKVSKVQQLNAGFNFTTNQAESNSYINVHSISRASLLLGNKYNLFNNRLRTYVAGRAEYFSAGYLPLTWSLATDYTVNREISFAASAAKVFRQPTLNELYWSPGGNINIKPEEGYSIDGTVFYKKTLAAFELNISGTLFNKVIGNWIVWVPGSNGNASAMNIQKVWSRGTETSWKLQYRKNKMYFSMNLQSAYVLSTSRSNIQENDNALNRQLVYTPRYNISGNLVAGYQRTQIFFAHQYIGYRFTSSDNSRWLEPYHMSMIRLTQKFLLGKSALSFFVSCNNLFNINYSVVAYRPMPLRNYEAGLTLEFNHPSKK